MSLPDYFSIAAPPSPGPQPPQVDNPFGQAAQDQNPMHQYGQDGQQVDPALFDKIGGTIPDHVKGIADAIADKANKDITTEDVIQQAKGGTYWQDRVGQLAAAKMQEQNAIASQQAAQMQLQQHFLNSPAIPQHVKAELSDPQKFAAVIGGLLSGGFDTTGQVLGIAQKNVDAQSQQDYAMKMQDYQARLKNWQEEGNQLKAIADQARFEAGQAGQNYRAELGDQRMRDIAESNQQLRAQMAQDKAMQDHHKQLAAQADKDIAQFQKNEKDVPIYSQQNVEARQAFVNGMVEKYKDLGLDAQMIESFLGAQRQVGNKSIKQQDLERKATLADNTINRTKVGNAIKIWSGKLATIRMNGIVTEEQQAALSEDRDQIAEQFDIPANYLELPPVGKTWQRVAAESSAQSRRDAFDLSRERFDFEKTKFQTEQTTKTTAKATIEWAKEHKKFQDAYDQNNAAYQKAVNEADKARDEWMKETDEAKKKAKKDVYDLRNADIATYKVILDKSKEALDNHEKTAPQADLSGWNIQGEGNLAPATPDSFISTDGNTTLPPASGRGGSIGGGGSFNPPKAPAPKTQKQNGKPAAKGGPSPDNPRATEKQYGSKAGPADPSKFKSSKTGISYQRVYPPKKK